MIDLAPPQWPLAGLFAAIALANAVALRRYLRDRDVWRYDTRAAWLRAFSYFWACWSVAAATGTLATVLDNPVVRDDPSAHASWIASTIGVVALIVVGYGVVWPRGTEAHGRRLVIPDTLLFGLAWGLSEGLLYGSTWVTARRVFADVPGGRVWTVVVVVLVLSAFTGVWHAVYWDVHVSPEHNIVDWNPRKVGWVHTPNLVLTAIYVTAFDELAIWVGLQALALFASSVAMPFPTFRRPHPQPPDRPVLGPPGPVANPMHGKVVVITGGAAGIGSMAATGLAGLGARVVVLDRDAPPPPSAGPGLEHLPCDLADLDAVRAAADTLLAAYPVIDVLILNAGVFRASYAVTPAGHEVTLATNHLGHHLLTSLLEDRLLTSGARVIAVSSDAHWQATDVDWDDVGFAAAWEGAGAAPSTGFAAYNRSKLLLTATAMERAERWAGSGATCNVVTPGALVPTAIYDDLTGPLAWFLRVMRPLLRTPEKGARGHVYLATSPEVERVSGWYFKDLRPIAPSLRAQDPAFRAEAWAWSDTACGLAPAGSGVG